MKKKIAWVLAILLCVVGSGVAQAADIDLSTMTAEELAAFRDTVETQMEQANYVEDTFSVGTAMMYAGKEIPTGKWTVKAMEDEICYIDWTRPVEGEDWPDRKKFAISTEEVRTKLEPEEGYIYTTEYTFDLEVGDWLFMVLAQATFSRRIPPEEKTLWKAMEAWNITP